MSDSSNLDFSSDGNFESKNHKGLKRNLGVTSIISLGVGATVGTGIFSTMSQVASISNSSLILIIAFLIGGLLQIPSSLCFSELASAYPEDGGYYVYLKHAGSKPLAFLTGWICFFATDAPSVSIIALGMVNYLGFLIHVDYFILKIITVFIILFFMFTHIRSVKGGSIVQSIITVLKILPFVFIIGVGAFYMKNNPFDVSGSSYFTNAIINDSGIFVLLTSIAATSFSFDGLFSPCYISGEVKNPHKVLPIGLISSAVIVLVMYCALTFVSSGVLGIEEIANSSAPLADVASRLPLIGSYAGVAVAVSALVVIAGSITSAIMYMPRVQYAMAIDGYFFKIFGKVHSKYQTPYMSIIINTLLIIVLLLLGDISSLLTYFTIVMLLKNALGIGTIFVLRKKENYFPKYRTPGGLIFPIIAISFNIVLIIGCILGSPIIDSIIALLVVCTGIPAYYFWNKKNSK